MKTRYFIRSQTYGPPATYKVTGDVVEVNHSDVWTLCYRDADLIVWDAEGQQVCYKETSPIKQLRLLKAEVKALKNSITFYQGEL